MIEYVSAFIVGLLVFQALMMVGMYGGNYLLAVRKTFFAETVSMNTVMVGDDPRDARPDEPRARGAIAPAPGVLVRHGRGGDRGGGSLHIRSIDGW